jgi:hypothetical protein
MFVERVAYKGDDAAESEFRIRFPPHLLVLESD